MILARQLSALIGVVYQTMHRGFSPGKPSRRRVIPRVEGPLEERDLPTTLPIVGVFTGAYHDVSMSDTDTQNDAGFIVLTIASVTSSDSMSATVTGSVRITGFAGQDATLPFQAGFEQQSNAGAISISVQAEDDTIDMGFPGFISLVGEVQGNAILVRSYDVNGIGGYATATPDPNVVLTPGQPPAVSAPSRSKTLGGLTLEQIQEIVPPPTAPSSPHKGPPGFQKTFARKLAAYNRISSDLVTYLNSTEATQTYQINTPQRRAAFIGQVAAATANLTTLTDETGHSRYQGRGLLPLTGKANYAAASKALGLGQLLVKFPDLVASKDTDAERTAGYLWKSNQLNSLADRWDIDGITRRLGGPKGAGAAQRRELSMKALNVLNAITAGPHRR
jgi:predicted chitinase